MVLEDQDESAALGVKLGELIKTSEYSKSVAKDGGNAAYVWLGATDDPKSAVVKGASEGNWLWVDGTSLPTSRAEWGSGPLGKEPDNAKVGSVTQNYLALGLENWPKGSASGAGIGDAGDWNDVVGTNTLYYVVEWAMG